MVKYGPFGLGNNSKYIFSLIADSGNVIHSTCQVYPLRNAAIIITIPEQDLFIVTHLNQNLILGSVPPVASRDWNLIGLVVGKLMGNGGIIIVRLNKGIPADESLGLIHPQRTGDQSRFTQYPESIPDTDQNFPTLCKIDQGNP